jgi:hypothetical protein
MKPSKELVEMARELIDDNGSTCYGCASYEESWRPGIQGWGATDEESRADSVIRVIDAEGIIFKIAEFVARDCAEIAERTAAEGVSTKSAILAKYAGKEQ